MRAEDGPSGGLSVVDARGQEISLKRPARRIVSLVPSVTETLFALGVGAKVVGRTHFCIRPQLEVRTVTVVGGTKSVNPQVVEELRPDLVLANLEENRPEIVGRLEQLAPVLVTFPRSVPEAIRDIRTIGRLVGAEERARQLAMGIGSELGALRSLARHVRLRLCYLIWRQPYMTVGRDTFVSSLLEEGGAENVFGELEERYPRVSPAEIFSAEPDVVLLPSEPFHFLDKHLLELAQESGDPARWRPRLRRVPGDLFCWHGVRLLQGLPYYRELLQEIAGERAQA